MEREGELSLSRYIYICRCTNRDSIRRNDIQTHRPIHREGGSRRKTDIHRERQTEREGGEIMR